MSVIDENLVSVRFYIPSRYIQCSINNFSAICGNCFTTIHWKGELSQWNLQMKGGSVRRANFNADPTQKFNIIRLLAMIIQRPQNGVGV